MLNIHFSGFHTIAAFQAHREAEVELYLVALVQEGTGKLFLLEAEGSEEFGDALDGLTADMAREVSMPELLTEFQVAAEKAFDNVDALAAINAVFP